MQVNGALYRHWEDHDRECRYRNKKSEVHDDCWCGCHGAKTDNGRFVVPFKTGSFDTRLVTNHTGPIAFLVLPRTGGWRPIEREISHPNQAYKKKAHEILNDYKAREIAIVGLNSGKWRTVWVKNGGKATHPGDEE